MKFSFHFRIINFKLYSRQSNKYCLLEYISSVHHFFAIITGFSPTSRDFIQFFYDFIKHFVRGCRVIAGVSTSCDLISYITVIFSGRVTWGVLYVFVTLYSSRKRCWSLSRWINALYERVLTNHHRGKSAQPCVSVQLTQSCPRVRHFPCTRPDPRLPTKTLTHRPPSPWVQ